MSAAMPNHGKNFPSTDPSHPFRLAVMRALGDRCVNKRVAPRVGVAEEDISTSWNLAMRNARTQSDGRHEQCLFHHDAFGCNNFQNRNTRPVERRRSCCEPPKNPVRSESA